MEKNINLLIEHQCPQCGAPAVLEETDRLFFCEFCRVKSYLMPRGVLRYVLPHKAPEDKELIYVPYWRFKGMMFSTLHKGIDHRFLDVSLQALSSDLFPISLGLRSQSLKLKFTGSETPGRFLQASVPASAMLETMDTRFSANLPKPIFHQAHIGETLSLIYSPFYIGDQMMDAVLNRPVSGLLPDDFDIESFKGGPPKWPTEFIPTLCPDCGWDLHGQRDSLALLCYNCNSVWNPSKKGLKSIKFAHIPASNGDNPEETIYLPFWRIKVEFDGILLESYSDLIKVANLPKAPRPEYDNREFRFWTPAFKVRPQTFINLGKNLTLSQPVEKMSGKLPTGRLVPATLPLREGIESLKTILSSFVKPPGNMLPLMPGITISAKSFLQVWVPFREGHHEYIHQDYSLAINKNLLALSTNL